MHNSGTIDLNRLNAFFLEQALDSPVTIEATIAENVRDKGWLIFATHDVCEQPTRFGCTPEFFATVVDWARRSGAEMLSVSAAFKRLTGDRREKVTTTLDSALQTVRSAIS